MTAVLGFLCLQPFPWEHFRPTQNSKKGISISVKSLSKLKQKIKNRIRVFTHSCKFP